MERSSMSTPRHRGIRREELAVPILVAIGILLIASGQTRDDLDIMECETNKLADVTKPSAD